MDLGKKVSIPRDVLLEELSHLSNYDARLLKRWQRSDKYTFENVQYESRSQINHNIAMQNGKWTEATWKVVHSKPHVLLPTPRSHEVPQIQKTLHPDILGHGRNFLLKNSTPQLSLSTVSHPRNRPSAVIPPLLDALYPKLFKPERKAEVPGYRSLFNWLHGRLSTAEERIHKLMQTTFKVEHREEKDSKCRKIVEDTLGTIIRMPIYMCD